MKRTLSYYLQLSFTLLICAFMLVPVLMSMTAGLTNNYFQGLSSGLTLRWVEEVMALYSDTLWLTLKLALATLLVNLIAGVPAAYFLACSTSRWARVFEELILLPVAIPGLAIALALIIVYGGVQDLRTSWLFILIGHVLYTLPFMVRAVLAVLHSIDLKLLEEGAASLGAGFLRRFFDVIIPNCKGGIISGALMTLTLSVAEFNLTWMLHTPMTKTLPVGLADSYASMRLEISSAYTLIFLVLLLPLMIGTQWVGANTQKKQLSPSKPRHASLGKNDEH
ncbi:ABC transporter permease [Neptunomonas antarctica]|uniref:Putative spermidine/putrescine transport system permease protein n=1 Tax=Neptunomonas antarctica TaxID=619304 RepID=A0A1N7IXZ0_9GAMM|nr:ABC transporter permease subunit [Neptunomonas antarctica]SIS41856.1 putative spermidine/putrescine transport system permease protein [Neptunomonas antarctica]